MTENAANIALCNEALGLLGAAEIELSGTTQNHVYCTTFFDDCRDEILESHPWNWGMLFKPLTRFLATTMPLQYHPTACGF